MKIDGTNISTYGLEVISLDGYFNLPARKKVLEEPGVDEKDIVYESREPVVTLFGEYVSLLTLKSSIDSFYAKIKSALKHDYILDEHGILFKGVITKGIKPEIIGTCVRLKLAITIVENELET